MLVHVCAYISGIFDNDIYEKYLSFWVIFIDIEKIKSENHNYELFLWTKRRLSIDQLSREISRILYSLQSIIKYYLGREKSVFNYMCES